MGERRIAMARDVRASVRTTRSGAAGLGGPGLGNTPRDRATGLFSKQESREPAEVAAELHDALLKNIDLERLHQSPPAEARRLVSDAIAALLPAVGMPSHGDAAEQVARMVLDEVLGLGPLQSLIDDPSVQEVMVNGPSQIYVERDGRLQRTDIRFRDDAHVRRIADRILAVIGRRVDESSPLVDARLADGSRVNITVPPASPKHSAITIRKFRKDRLDLEALVGAGSMDPRMAELLSACVSGRMNVLISGGTGSGKTTMLNAISSFIPKGERIITIEDPLELTLQQPHVVALEARPADMTGRNAITQRDLLRNTLRMRPDRIIVGEIRGSEAFEMLQAMNTGHDGSLSTVHANTPRDALSRVENMVLMAGFELPMSAIREQIASALNLVIQLERGADGVRRITTITEVTGMEGERITVQDLYQFDAEGRTDDGRIIGRFRPTGLRPTFAEDLAIRGVPLRSDLFAEGLVP